MWYIPGMISKDVKHAASAKIVLVTGSVRPKSLTTAVMGMANAEIQARGIVTAEVNATGLSTDRFGGELPQDVIANYRGWVGQAQGIVLCTPEYNGSYSAVMKAIIENLGFPSPLAGKDVALIGVATGVIGAIKALEHLRSVVSHCGGHVLPFALSIAEAHKAFDTERNCTNRLVAQQVSDLCGKLVDEVLRKESRS